MAAKCENIGDESRGRCTGMQGPTACQMEFEESKICCCVLSFFCAVVFRLIALATSVFQKPRSLPLPEQGDQCLLARDLPWGLEHDSGSMGTDDDLARRSASSKPATSTADSVDPCQRISFMEGRRPLFGDFAESRSEELTLCRTDAYLWIGESLPSRASCGPPCVANRRLYTLKASRVPGFLKR